MKNSSTITLVLVMAGFAAANTGTAFAKSDERESSTGYEAERDADAGTRPDQQRANLLRDEYASGSDGLLHWKVTDAVYDHTGKLSMLQHIVPMHDMAVFGRVTNGIIENGLKIDRVDAVFNEADTVTSEPHYHFTQKFL